jgi:ATP-dependent Clp protease protease subunit
MEVSEYYSNPRINLIGSVGEDMLGSLDSQIRNLTSESDTPLIVTLASGGGSVGYARAIYEELSLLQQKRDISLVARGICLSAAVTIAMSVPLNRRLATPNTKFLMHEGIQNGSPNVSGSLSARKIQLANFLKDFEDDEDENQWVIDVIAKGCNQPLNVVEGKVRDGVWLVGKEAVRFGLVGSLIGIPE